MGTTTTPVLHIIRSLHSISITRSRQICGIEKIVAQRGIDPDIGVVTLGISVDAFYLFLPIEVAHEKVVITGTKA